MSHPEYVYVTYIKTSPEKLWAALTNSEFTRQYWFGFDLVSSWQEGDSIAFLPQGDSSNPHVSGRVLQFNPPNVLSYSWEFPDLASTEEPSRVTFTLEKQGELVKLTVVHNQFTDGSVAPSRISKGWPAVLSSLKSLLESGEALVYQDWSNCG